MRSRCNSEILSQKYEGGDNSQINKSARLNSEANNLIIDELNSGVDKVKGIAAKTRN